MIYYSFLGRAYSELVHKTFGNKTTIYESQLEKGDNYIILYDIVQKNI